MVRNYNHTIDNVILFYDNKTGEHDPNYLNENNSSLENYKSINMEPFGGVDSSSIFNLFDISGLDWDDLRTNNSQLLLYKGLCLSFLTVPI